MKEFGLRKKEKLCSVVAIEQLFGVGGAEFSALAYPLRIVARRNSRRSSDAAVAFLISIPKKRLRHAVERVLMRRRVRESYRLLRNSFALPGGERVDVAFVYVADRVKSYRSVARAMERLLRALQKHYSTPLSADESSE